MLFNLQYWQMDLFSKYHFKYVFVRLVIRIKTGKLNTARYVFNEWRSITS